MQEKVRTRKHWLRIAAVVLLLLAVAGILIWRCWPREYSLADPRGYVALEDIPFEEGNTSILLINPTRWNYSALKEYGIIHSQRPNYPEDEETWRTWTNAYIVDFLSRIAAERPAVIRAIYLPNEHISELRYTPSSDGKSSFTSTEYHLGSRERHDSWIDTGTVDWFWYYDKTDGTPAWYTFLFPTYLSEREKMGAFYVQYFYGYDTEQDTLIHSLVHTLESKGLMQKDAD